MNNTDNIRNNTGRDASGRFTVGNSGRPLGAKARLSRAVLEQIKNMSGAALQKLWESVNAGEKWAIELVLSKILPANRTIEFEDITPEDIISALQSGDISTDEAKSISATIKSLSEFDDLKKIISKLNELEGAVNDKR